ncbi:hypothetical protein MIR68_009838 [Amoeboaphelidium protococcarum]|nr:hypothetical protein MIR68_009838 [Amoeboaphelidium protococcarum]
MERYYRKRYHLFSRFDDGIQLDDESWFSATPEIISRHHARHIVSRMVQRRVDQLSSVDNNNGKMIVLVNVIDAFSGSGSNSIQFALLNGTQLSAKTTQLGVNVNITVSIQVFAIELDAQKIANAQHNASIYGIDPSSTVIRWVQADLSNGLKVALSELINDDDIELSSTDAVFASPPWSGPEYKNEEYYSLSNLYPMNGHDMIRDFLSVSSNVALYLPRNTNVQELIQAFGDCKITLEANQINDVTSTLTVYSGCLS